MSREKIRTRIKFCGMTRAEDAQFAAALGVDFVGFVCVPGSARALLPQAVQAIAETLPAGIKTVALFQNAETAVVQEYLRHFQPALLQFHGREPAAFCAGFGLPWIKAVPMGEPQVYADWERDFAAAAALLADSHTVAGGGGSGHSFTWAQLPAAADRRLPLMLAGGLTPETVGSAIHAVRPWAVDVSSGTESGTKGIKDHRKMRAFVEAVRAADEA
ncbi:MAG: phosphoribosylanthranilate isomerase [Stagnimonas sp.]|nr:phosphoribosylanthranilate isomerase [Stagnimonas sp.]